MNLSVLKLLDLIEYPYIEDEENEDIILSPNAFENLLSIIDHDKFEMLFKIRECYIKIKNLFLKYLYDMNIKMQKNRKDQLETIDILINY